MYSKRCVKRPLSKRRKIGFQDDQHAPPPPPPPPLKKKKEKKEQLSLNVRQKYCRMLQGEHSPILSTFIKLPFVIKIFVSSIFEWPLYTGFAVNIILNVAGTVA